jgi:TatA/E family protein of Tat protein translocase
MTFPVWAMLQTPEIIALLVLALILFGAKKLPELAKGLGQGIKEFKRATRDVTDELHNAIESQPPPRSNYHPRLPERTEPMSGESSPDYYGSTPTEPSPAEPEPAEEVKVVSEESAPDQDQGSTAASPRAGQSD